MKKLFAVLLASLLVLSLTACGGKSDDSAGSDRAPADLNLEDVYQSLLDQQPKDADELVMLPESSPDILDGRGYKRSSPDFGASYSCDAVSNSGKPNYHLWRNCRC